MSKPKSNSEDGSAFPVKKEQTEPKHSENYYDSEGDIEILSSDNLLFKLHAYRLQASS